MKRQLITVGLAVFVLLLLAFITATVAAPGKMPVADTEPDNNNIEGADVVTVGSYEDGDIDPPEDLDYYVVNTEIGREYQTSLAIWENNELKLKMSLYYGEAPHDYVQESPASASSTSMSWTASQTHYYILVQAATVSTTTAKYRLSVNRVAATPTPTDTPTPTPTPSEPTSEDAYEPNNNFDEAYELPVVTSVSLSGLEGLASFYPVGDENWFKFWTKAGYWYQATTSELSGIDTYMEIRDRNNAVMESDDDSGGGYASQAQWEAGYNGYYYIRVTNKVETTGEYNLTVGETSAPATATPGPSPTPGLGPDAKADSCEDNLDFAHACIIAANQSQTFNFVPPHGGVDNDYYMIWVKPGLIYDCATSNLDPGVDTNMILYDNNRNGIGGNDDVEPGNPESAFSYYATYNGWLYLLVGVGNRTPSNIYNSNYTLRCDRRVPGQPTTTPTPEKAKPTNTPGPTTTPGTPTAGPTPTPAPSEGLTVRPLTTPTPVPAMTPAPQFVPISLLVYYDANDDRQPGAGEGIAGISAQAYEAATNQLLAQGFTDDQGSLEFTVAAQGPVRVSVPFFGFSQLVTGDGASIYVRVSSQPLPEESP